MSDRNPDTHAALDLDSRRRKANKIHELIRRQTGDGEGGIEILEVGTGSGVIASALAERFSGRCRVVGVDVVDQRVVTDGYEFVAVGGTELPFDDSRFDVVISNHVIEHVGQSGDQRNHLEEIHRVLGPKGFLYLAFPQKWGLYEPHYRVPFLSWFPRGIADRIVRTVSHRSHYDCLLPTRSGIKRMLRAAQFRDEEITLDVLDVMIRTEMSSATAQILSRIPRIVWKIALPVFPTLVFLCSKEEPVPPENPR